MISWQQSTMIIVVLLIILGPNKLPKIAKDIGKTIRSFKKETQEIKEQVDITKQIK
uniref:Twin-arginine translocase TatA/TatE family subunit n=1 Tax=Thermodesulfobium narugense TaxID=184064 RepID=A0A7C5PBI8_9BACT